MIKKDKRTKTGITLVAENCTMTGNIHFSDELTVNGVIMGDITADPGSKAKVTVSQVGRVEGDIKVPHVIVNGEVEGNIFSSKHIELASKASIKGNVFYNLIEMVMGSKVDGNLVHSTDNPEGAIVKRQKAKRSGDKSSSEQGEIDLGSSAESEQGAAKVASINNS